MNAPAHLQEGLANIRSGLRLQFNPRAVLVEVGKIGADGRVATKPSYEGRWEVWDTDPDGGDYIVFRCQDAKEQYLPPGEWVVERMRRWNPERFNGNVERMIEEFLAESERTREEMSARDAKSLFDAVAKEAAWVALPKSGGHIRYRGERVLSSQNM